MMWHNAVLSRVEKMPPLNDFLVNPSKNKVKRIDESAIMARLKAYQKRRSENVNSK